MFFKRLNGWELTNIQLDCIPDCWSRVAENSLANDSVTVLVRGTESNDLSLDLRSCNGM